ncbi:hypothetical protein CVD28_04700 [Bacillus sp. M6-12]|nr:hypothetical protein CVD28_04700 [Bacillus sp. M6-12]
MLIYFLKTLFGSLEVLGVLLISTAIFRSTYGLFLKELLWISVLVSIVQTIEYDMIQSYFVINEFTVIFMIFILSKLFLKATWWHSILLSLTGYISGLFVQSIFIFILDSFQLIGMKDVIYTPFATCIVQTVEFLILLLISKGIRKSRFGFIFVYDSMNYRSKLKIPTIAMFIFFASLICLELVAMYFATKDIVYWNFLLSSLFVLLPLTFGSIYLRSTKELEEYHEKLYIPDLFK